MFSLTSLNCFAVAAKELNFTRASKKLHISQQALSHHILHLESYFGAQLFNRSNPMTLTESGIALFKYTKVILNCVDSYSREIQDIKNFRQGSLTIGIPVTRGTIMLPPLLSAFHQLFPQIKLDLVEGTVSESIFDALYNGEADLYIGYQPENTQELESTPLYEEKFVVMVPNSLLKQHPVHIPTGISRSIPLSIGIFKDIPFVAQDPETMNGQVFYSLCQDAGIKPNVVVSTQNLITETALCMEGVGACVIPHTFLPQNSLHARLCSTPLFSQTGLNRLSVFELDSSCCGVFKISVCRLRGKLLTRAGQEFINLAKEIYSVQITD